MVQETQITFNIYGKWSYVKLSMIYFFFISPRKLYSLGERKENDFVFVVMKDFDDFEILSINRIF